METLIVLAVFIVTYVVTVWFFGYKIYNINKKLNPFKAKDVSSRWDYIYDIKSKENNRTVARAYSPEEIKTKLLEYNKIATIRDIPDLTIIKDRIDKLENPTRLVYKWRIWEYEEAWKWQARIPKTNMRWNETEPNWWLAEGEALTSDLARNDVITAIRSHQLEMISPTKIQGYEGTVYGKFQR